MASPQRTVISVEHLSKAYRLGMIGSGTLRDDLSRWWAKVRGRPDPLLKVGEEHHLRRMGQHFWALENVSFEVEEGEVLGIIGRNGAGKSTLLKILSQVTAPTSGWIRLRGRVASLLEVGTGFHPELTGRENVFLNGAILGMTKDEIRRKFDEIVAFSECEEFIDTPVKRYSSGMYVRLAFAIAAHLEPEILIVDEVLAVGDAQFQRKCLGKMGEVSRGGRTVLFVSHNMVAVQNLCRRVVWLDAGRLVADGAANNVLADYLKATCPASAEQDWTDPRDAPGNEVVRLRSIRLVPESGERHEEITVRTPFSIEVTYWNLKPQVGLNVCLALTNQEGLCVLASPNHTDPTWQGQPFPCGLFRSTCHIPGDFLNNGLHSVTVWFVQDMTTLLYRADNALTFDIQDSASFRGDWYGKWVGAVRPMLKWQTQQVLEQANTSGEP